jgi:hypothetical protein
LAINLITIRGSAQQMRDLKADPVKGLDVHYDGVRSADGGLFETGAYASEDAMGEIEARGITIEIQMNSAELSAHWATLEAESTDPEGGIV